MELNETEEFLEREFEYPVTLARVREEVGHVELDTPDEEDSESISDVLGHLDEDTYESANDLFETILANLPDEYVGRKYYSDRGGDGDEAVDGPADEEDQSF